MSATKSLACGLLGALLCVSVASAKEHRSEAAKHRFEIITGWPHGRAGYWVDHVRPLACGGPDKPSNMAWQKKRDAMAKDKWERQDCSVWLTTAAPCVVINKERDEVCNGQK